MRVDSEGDKIIVTLEAPWEKELHTWINEVYGPNNLKKFITQYFVSKARSKELQENIDAAVRGRSSVDAR